MQKFPRIYNKSDFSLTANVTAQPSMWTTIGQVTVPAQQYVTFGIGSVAGGVDTREVCYIDLKDTTPANVDGKVRFVLADANLVKKIVVAEQRTERLRASQNDKTQGFLLGEFPIKAREDSKLLIEFYPDSTSAVTISASDSTMLVPVTVYQ